MGLSDLPTIDEVNAKPRACPKDGVPTPIARKVRQKSKDEHAKQFRERVLRVGGNPNTDRICSVCGAVKPLEAFNRNSRNVSTGRQPSCRDCQHAYTKTYQRRPRRRVV